MIATVVDASAAVDALLPTPRQAAALRHLRGQELYAPAVIDVEVLSALARLERSRQLPSVEADRAVDDWTALPIRRIGNDALLRGAWQSRPAIRIADGFYVALAKALGARLLTSDTRLARAPLEGVTVTVLR